jgi:flagellar protein FliL
MLQFLYNGLKETDLVNKILTIVALVSTFAVLGLYVYTDILFQKPAIDQDKEFGELQEESRKVSIPATFEVNKMIVNLPSTSSRLRFIEISVHFVPFKEEYTQRLTGSENKIKDTIIDVAGKMKPDKLNSVAGKILLEKRIKDKLNDYYNKAIVKELYFTRFVIQ